MSETSQMTWRHLWSYIKKRTRHNTLACKLCEDSINIFQGDKLHLQLITLSLTCLSRCTKPRWHCGLIVRTYLVPPGWNLVWSQHAVSNGWSAWPSIPALHVSPFLAPPSLHTRLPSRAGWAELCVTRAITAMFLGIQQAHTAWWTVTLVAWVFGDETCMSFAGRSRTRYCIHTATCKLKGAQSI